MARIAVSNRTQASKRFLIRNYPNSVKFTGGNGTSSANTVSGTGAFALASWVRWTALPGAFQRFMVIGGDSSHFFALQSDTSNFWGWGETGDAANVSSTTKIDLNWHFAVVTCAGGAGGAVNLYLDNTLIKSGTASNNITGSLYTEGAGIGGFSSTTEIAQSLGWSRALSTTELTSLYYSNIVPQNGLMFRYNHTEGSGTTVADSSGNGNNMTLSGSQTWVTDSPFKSRSAVSGRLTP